MARKPSDKSGKGGRGKSAPQRGKRSEAQAQSQAQSGEAALTPAEKQRHYEVVFLVHPDQSDQVPGMIDRYRQLMADSGGSVHRVEDWGRRQLAYPIDKVHKAHYVLMNIACDSAALEELSTLFRFNDAVLRNLIVKMKQPVTGESFILKFDRESKERRARMEQKRRQEEAAAAAQAAAKAEAEAAAAEAAEAEAEDEAESEAGDEAEAAADADVSPAEAAAEAAAESADAEETAATPDTPDPTDDRT